MRSQQGRSIATGLALEEPRIARSVKPILRALRRNPNMAAGLAVLVLVVIISVAAPLITFRDHIRTDPVNRLLAPSGEFWFGTDHVGRDVYARTMFGGRISLIVGGAVAGITALAGIIIGLLSGYYRQLDEIVMRFMDGLMAFPTLLLALALMALLGSSVQNVIICICVVETPRMVRVVRASVLSLRDQTFVEAARALGARPLRILLLHVLPNTLAPVSVQAAYIFALAILIEASLSFLGAGTPPYIPSWGNIMGQGRTYLQMAVWVTFFPGVFLTLAVLAINLVGDGLRDALDPKLARRG